MRYISNSKKGIARDRNQDRILIVECDAFYLFTLFDGVSSYPNSYKFINEFKKEIRKKKYDIDSNGTNLDKLLHDINKQIIKKGVKGKSTLTGLFYSRLNKTVKFINIGDSRIYSFSNQFIEQITEDDSLIGRKNVLTKCLGCDILQITDFKLVKIKNSENYLMCSDGFYKLMDENLKEYFLTFRFKNIQNIKKKLSQLQRRKNLDDSSYILIKDEV